MGPRLRRSLRRYLRQREALVPAGGRQGDEADSPLPHLFVSKPGDRRDYFAVKPGAWAQAMGREAQWLAVARRMAGRGLDLANAEAPEERRPLEEMDAFFAHLQGELPALLERWEDKTATKR